MADDRNVFHRPDGDVIAEGIDKVLAHFPHSAIEWTKITDLWTVIKLVGGEAVIQEVAIWNATGNVYRVGLFGAVEDDPFIVVTPL
jgi:hypothetical protein